MFKRLGEDLMDDDHNELARLFARVHREPEAGLAALVDTIAVELGAHFAREEEALARARAPTLLTHIEEHQRILRELETMRRELGRAGAETARHLIGAMLPLMIRDHILSADTASAAYLKAGG